MGTSCVSDISHESEGRVWFIRYIKSAHHVSALSNNSRGFRHPRAKRWSYTVAELSFSHQFTLHFRSIKLLCPKFSGWQRGNRCWRSIYSDGIYKNMCNEAGFEDNFTYHSGKRARPQLCIKQNLVKSPENQFAQTRGLEIHILHKIIMAQNRYGLQVVGSEDQETKDMKLTVPLKQVNVEVTMKGFIVNVVSTLVYENQGDAAVDTKFVFPMDEMSSVYHFEAEINGRNIIAECQDKEQARDTYKEAIRHGRTAMYMCEMDYVGDIFECKLGNLPPNVQAKLTFSYVLELNIEADGFLTFTLPTVLHPRYTPPGYQLPVQEDDTTPIHYTDTVYKMNFGGKVEGQHTIKKITSSNNVLSVDVCEDKKSAQINLPDGFQCDHDLSFTVEYEDVTMPTVILEKGSNGKEGILKTDVLMVNFFPELSSAPETRDSEFIFIIDCSGSMRGERIKRASETLHLLLKSLSVGCTFNVVCFGSTYNTLFDRPEQYNEESLKKAVELQKNMKANMGGTQILEPMKAVYATEPTTYRQLFLLTDGGVSNTEEVISLSRDNRHTTRVFTFGIESGASTSLIKNVAMVTDGRATFIKDRERLQSKVLTVLKFAMQPSVNNLKLEWTLPSGCTAVNLPDKTRPVFKGEKMVVYALIQGAENLNEEGKSSLVLTGSIGDKTITHNVTFDLVTSKQSDASYPIHRLAAKAQIKEYEMFKDPAYGALSKKAEIIFVSLASNIVSRYTAFVGIDKESKELVDGNRLLTTDTAYELQYCGLQSLKFCSRNPMNYFPKASSAPLGKQTFYESPDTTGFSECLPRRTRSSKKAKSASCQPSPQLSSGDKDSQLGNIETKIARKDGTSNMLALIELQKFDGSWKLDRDLAKVLGKSLAVLSNDDTLEEDRTLWATALAVAYLRWKHTAEKTEWEMIEKKALSWMSKEGGKNPVEKIITSAKGKLMSD